MKPGQIAAVILLASFCNGIASAELGGVWVIVGAAAALVGASVLWRSVDREGSR